MRPASDGFVILFPPIREPCLRTYPSSCRKFESWATAEPRRTKRAPANWKRRSCRTRKNDRLVVQVCFPPPLASPRLVPSPPIPWLLDPRGPSSAARHCRPPDVCCPRPEPKPFGPRQRQHHATRLPSPVNLVPATDCWLTLSLRRTRQIHLPPKVFTRQHPAAIRAASGEPGPRTSDAGFFAHPRTARKPADHQGTARARSHVCSRLFLLLSHQGERVAVRQRC